MNWKYQDKDKTAVFMVDGEATRSCLVIADEIQAYIAAGGIIDPYTPPPVDHIAEAKNSLQATDPEAARFGEDALRYLIMSGAITPSPDLAAKLQERDINRAIIRGDLVVK